MRGGPLLTRSMNESPCRTESIMLLRGRVIFGDRPTLADGVVAIDGERITYAGPSASCPFPLDKAEQVPIITPGLIDVHHHGGAGGTYADDPQAAITAATHHHHMGSTTLIASVVSATHEQMQANIDALAPLVHDGVLDGIHLEGPFISCEKKGAHDPNVIVPGNPAWFTDWCERGNGAVRSITLAAETAHFDELITLCRSFNVVPSVGHTDADADQTRHALQADERAGRIRGPWTTTHLFNAMNGIHHRVPGPIPYLLDLAKAGQTTVELIADGVHVQPDIVRMTADAAGDGLILITDSMAAAGLSDGDYVLGTLDVTVTDGVARLKTGDGSEGAIAGGTSRLIFNVQRCIVDYGLDERQIIRAATSRPAELYGLKDRGRLATGMRADVLVLTATYELTQVIRNGKVL